MKVFLASLIPLLVSLSLLLPEVKCRWDDENARAMKFRDYFDKYNLAAVCGICKKEYDIDKDNCIQSKLKAKLKCMVKVAKNRKFFQSKWDELAAVNNEKPTDVEEYFSPKYLKKTCKICGDIGFLSEANCLTGEDVARRYCKGTIDEMHRIFQQVWNITSLNPEEEEEIEYRIMKRSVPARGHIEGLNLQKVCSICQKYFGIDEASCIKNTQKETHDCLGKVKESQAFLDFNWAKWNSPAPGQPSDVVDFSENGKNLGQMCPVCNLLFDLSSSDCFVHKEGIRQKCQNWLNEFWKLMEQKKKKSSVPLSSESASLKFSNAEN